MTKSSKKILIDATYTEQIRLAIVDGNYLENYDQEIADNKTLKGNIYLAKVTRVEPSLQACFVDYGRERHGFLSLSEIHPDYYRIPTADKKALMEDLYRENEREQNKYPNHRYRHNESTAYRPPRYESTDADLHETDEKNHIAEEHLPPEDENNGTATNHQDDSDHNDIIEQPKASRFVRRSRYKIQEVIKKGQVILVQVVKDERGLKGAAMTSYLSLAGRYCVVMPNSTKGGGISRKIGIAERDYLRNIMNSLEVPEGMGLIIRTAGADRSEAEIKADYDYVLKLWDEIRQLTVSSEAPLMIYEEGSLVKKSIRNYNNSHIDEIWVEGEAAFEVAMETMKAIAPEEVGKLKQYLPKNYKNKNIFHYYDIEYEIQSIYEPYVSLRSGGMLVINQTEALVAIDVNSGKAIRQRNIEETALHTNMEAAAEVARQLRLRDLSGQIVIDFIDMENHRNTYQVEKFFREQLRQDRARVQVSRIGIFGMLEMTRQRLRPSITETVMHECPHCHGTGKTFRPKYYSLQFLRELFNLVQEKGTGKIIAEVPSELEKELLATKQEKLREIEDAYKVDLEFVDLPPKSLEPYIINYSKGRSKNINGDDKTKKATGKGRAKKTAPLDFISANLEEPAVEK